ncbi:MAG: peptidoglycan hydrolase-like protein with peptidoglycan-binding domain/predicted chitinase, partial [Cognaticolwellia sp.]
QLRTQAMDGVVVQVVDVLPESSRTNGEPHVRAVLNELAMAGIGSRTQAAYILATADHESGFGNPRFSRSEPLVEERNNISQGSNGSFSGTDHVKDRRISGDSLEDAETNYWDSAYGGRLGNERGTTDAKDYRGRGYVQLTGEENYDRMTTALNAEGFVYTHEGVTYGGPEGQPIDLLTNFEHVNLVPALAARVMVKGMMEGSFTGKALDSEVNGSESDFYNARAVVNGDKEENGSRIATKAWKYVTALGQWDKVISLTKGRSASGDGSTWAPTPGAAQDTGPISALIDGPLLRRGANGDRVRELQRLLNLHGAKVTVDGDFGRGTQRALTRFQRQRGLEVDGMAGPEVFQVLSGGADSADTCAHTSTDATVTTVEELSQALGGGLDADEDMLKDAKAAVSGRPILRQGSKGHRVEALQELLSAAGFPVGMDGDYGAVTRRAVLAFQTAQGLSADGRVGRDTAARLKEVATTAQATAHTSGGAQADTAPAVAAPIVAETASTSTNGPVSTAPVTDEVLGGGGQGISPSANPTVAERGELAARAARQMYAEGVEAHGTGSWETQGSNWGPLIEELKESNNADSGSWAQGLPWCGMFVGHQYSKVGIREEIMDHLVFWSGLRLHSFFTEGKYVGQTNEGPDSWWQQHQTVDLRNESSESNRKAMVDGFAPQAGDVVLFRNALDHVAVVSSYDASTGALNLMEGNRSNKVQASVYYPDRDTSVAFFGRFNESDFDPAAQVDASVSQSADPRVTHTNASGAVR